MRRRKLERRGKCEKEQATSRRERGKKGIIRRTCLSSESGGASLALSLVLGVHLEREGGHAEPWLLSRPVPGGGLDLLSALSLPCSPRQPTSEEVLLGAIQGVGA